MRNADCKGAGFGAGYWMHDAGYMMQEGKKSEIRSTKGEKL
jgi:hypothetical protein